jgi:hypothetical protein
MRLWSLNPQHLDRAGLVALWREALLAQAVLLGKTRGYKNHSQLIRFKAASNPVAAIGRYLSAVADEADRRGYKFNRTKIHASDDIRLTVTTGQMEYETAHLTRKLDARAPEMSVDNPQPHPMFAVVPGGVEGWERTK